ncbi:hypothetical protein Dda_3305 [Drechslerella dactyloides]|uniref:Uncharacterized protein n=1 Tax=Drechslerella dactyloides TaxID=74499 RepID=A0AAD6NLM7_DREDA|nr:hypothetical protein Dda_3305 [Drechslerella dactyloides]
MLVVCWWRRNSRSSVRQSQLKFGLWGRLKPEDPEHEYDLDLDGTTATDNLSSSRSGGIIISRPRKPIKTFRFPSFSNRVPPLDDAAILKAFNELDNRITDHVSNFWHNGSTTSTEYQECIRSQQSRASWSRILHDGQPLLVDLAARTQMFRAILAYHVYATIVDWKALFPQHEDTKEAEESGTSSISIAERANFIRDLLERASEHHLPTQSRDERSDLRRQNLYEIALIAVSISIQLASQLDDFKFEFRNKDGVSTPGRALLEVKLLGETEVDMSTIEVVNGMENGTVRALVAPGIIRVLRKNGKEHVIRKAQVWMA